MDFSLSIGNTVSRAFSDSALGANGEMTHRWDQRPESYAYVPLIVESPLE